MRFPYRGSPVSNEVGKSMFLRIFSLDCIVFLTNEGRSWWDRQEADAERSYGRKPCGVCGARCDGAGDLLETIEPRCAHCSLFLGEYTGARALIEYLRPAC